MSLKGFGLIGLVIFFAAIGIGAVLLVMNQNAQSRDHSDEKHGVVVSDYPPCVWELSIPQRILSENNSQTIVVNTTNATDTECQSQLTLLAPGFDVNPRKEFQTIAAKSQAKGSVAWIVIPHKSGEFDIAVSDGLNTQALGITVTNVLGLTATQAQLCSILGTLLGPMLSVPWWVDRWQKRKRPKEQAAPPPPVPSKTAEQ